VIDKCCATLKVSMNTLIFPILRQLSDGKFHSGEALASQFNVTRATIWNAIQAAEEMGVEIFSVRGRGYQLPTAFTPLNATAILKALGDKAHAFSVEVHDELTSTNTYLMQNAPELPNAICVVAQLQTDGRGRRGRTWQASLGASLTFSVLWRFQCGASSLSGLSLAVGVALIRALNALGINEAKLKWPNDVLVLHNTQTQVQSQKLAGILIELQGDMEGPSVAVIGIGLNVKLPAKLQLNIDQSTTDLATLLGKSIDANIVLGKLLTHLYAVLDMFTKEGFAPLRDEWTRYHAYHKQPVNLLHPDGRVTHGVVNNIADDGVLFLQTDAGEQRFMSGEISLRGAIR
jgi:BirA family transcriptional regulator, biotin operon repressor / biotin---[acetyl-CoA-carboxylase] ligase